MPRIIRLVYIVLGQHQSMSSKSPHLIVNIADRGAGSRSDIPGLGFAALHEEAAQMADGR